MKGIEGLLAGHTLAGRYRIEEVIGRGGFAAVYRARDETLQRTVAVKIIMVSSPDPESRRRLRARFHREARAAARLQHPNVVTIYDFGTDPDLGLDFLVMELLRGEDLAARTIGAGPLPVPQALRILRQAAEGVAAGHRAGLIHRDVKPGNLFLARQEDAEDFRVKVLDFGIAQIVAADDTVTQLTHGGHALSPAYAAPEQLRGERSLSPAVDVFGLGVIGYELLAGERLFGRGEDVRARGEVPPLRARHPEVPAALDALIARAMDPDPAARYPDAGAMAEALETLDGAASAEPPVDRRVLPPVYRARRRPRLPAEPPSPVPDAGRATSGRSGVMLVALLLLVAAAGLGWWALSGGGGAEEVAQRPDPEAPAAEARDAPDPAVDELPSAVEPVARAGGGGRGAGGSSAPAPDGPAASWAGNAEALYREGIGLFQRRDFDGAVQRLRDAVRLDPDNVVFRNDLAWALFRAGRVDEAGRELDEVLRRDPGRAIAHANRGEVRLAQGDTAAAIDAYRRFLELNDDPRRDGIARRRLAEIGG